MSYILSLETSTKSCSVALHENEKLLGLQELHIEKSHSGLLHALIANLLANCGVAKNSLNAIAVSEGPGSYTGLRIGTSAAKGLCFALDIPFIAVSTLAAMAWGMQASNVQKALLCPMIDARRMEVYSQVFDGDFQPLTSAEAVVIDENSYSQFLERGPIVFFGDGANKCIPVIGNNVHAYFAGKFYPSARWVGELAFEKYKNNEFSDLVNFEPFYLKDFRTTQPKNR